MKRHIIHLHIPAFPISVARVCQPELRDRPVAVAPVQSERAIILAASFEAKKEGIFKGMALSQAMKLCPDLTLLPPVPELTERACRSLAGVVSHYTPLWEQSRPGNVYLDLKIWFSDFSLSFQSSLFPGLRAQGETKSHLIKALDCIRERYGETSIQYGRTLQ